MSPTLQTYWICLMIILCCNVASVCVCVLLLSRVLLSATSRTVTRQAPLSMEFSRQEYLSGLPFPTLGDLPDPGIEPVSPVSPALQADSLPTEPSGEVL